MFPARFAAVLSGHGDARSDWSEPAATPVAFPQ